MRVLAGVAMVLAACYSPSPMAGGPCSAAGECPEGQSCDTTQTPPTCVAALIDASIDASLDCVTSNDCSNANLPVCDDVVHQCRGCRADAECNGICTEYNGVCVGNGQSIFVSPTGTDGGNCMATSPCRTFSFAMQQMTANRRTIRVGDGEYMSSGSPALAVTDTSGRIVFSGEDADPNGAFFTAVSNGSTNPVTVQFQASTDVVIEGITVRNGTNDGVRVQGAALLSRMTIQGNLQRGIDHQPNNMAALHIWDSLIENNQEGINSNDGSIEVLRSVVRGNRNGGIQVQKSTTTLISTLVVRNGATNSPYGGLRLIQLTGQSVIAFVTVAFNTASSSTAPGIASDTLAIDASIITDNVNAVIPSPQICPGCTATYSLFSGTPPIGMGNIAGPAGFVDEANNDFHLMATSAARDAGNPAGSVIYDLDGDKRPLGDGYDIGADEIVP
ncbi:MAG TPA: choice-of-anchor Q domain-containing protein [Kofleriaceae bacterium]